MNTSTSSGPRPRVSPDLQREGFRSLLLDEPTSDLDPRNTALIEDAVLEARSREIGVVIATHDTHQAERIADRVAVLLENEIIEVGSTERVFEEPIDEWTRKFIDGEPIY